MDHAFKKARESYIYNYFEINEPIHVAYPFTAFMQVIFIVSKKVNKLSE